MAQTFPNLENISRLKVKPTNGEMHLLKILTNSLQDDFEIYFQPMLNGDMPDIIIMKKGYGVAIIEVKDWNLASYHIDENNNWHENFGDHKIRSPFQQAFGYKKNLFDLHINGLAERNIANSNFYKTIKVFVYFHKSEILDIKNIFNHPESIISEKRYLLNGEFKNGRIEASICNKKMEYLETKERQVSRDKSIAIHEKNMGKLFKSLNEKSNLFNDEIYEEFKRYLQPPFHVVNQGIEIKYDTNQSKLIISNPGYQKIKGTAGSGKTTILAKRAVNAHKRHNDKVLILTYNKTLRNHIRDKISEVREDFSWDAFSISNYHSFITQAINTCGISINPPEDAKLAQQYMENLYSKENLFDKHEEDIYKYKTILIDEIQDYQPEWIKIIRKYFLEENGEMVIFGNDSQNIYSRNISKRDSTLVQGFGRWDELKKSYRAKNDSLITRLGRNFQNRYLTNKYGSDSFETGQSQGALSLEILKYHQLSCTQDIENSNQIFDYLIKFIKSEKIHPNDICIISTNIELLRKLDDLIHKYYHEKTQTTFETEDQFIKITTRPSTTSKNKQDIKSIRDSKKLFFNLNSGLIKLSTIQSFKGMESPTSVYIISNHDNDEMVYTGITRSRKNLILFLPKENLYIDFFKNHVEIS